MNPERGCRRLHRTVYERFDTEHEVADLRPRIVTAVFAQGAS
jgi:hypothetical protein